MNKFLSKLRGILEPPAHPSLPRENRDNTDAAVEPEARVEPILEQKDEQPEIEHTLSIEELWGVYEEWLGNHFKQSLEFLNPGVSEDHLVILEKSLNSDLPEDYRDWLKVHNGQSSKTPGLIYGNELLSVSRMLEEWIGMKKGLIDQNKLDEGGESSPKNAVQSIRWSADWLPISADASGSLVCLDLAPADDGFYGQVIDFDQNSVHRNVLANNFREYVTSYLDELAAKSYGYSQTEGKILPQ